MLLGFFMVCVQLSTPLKKYWGVGSFKDQLYQCLIICHFIIELKQKNNTIQQDCGVHLSFHGASDDALTAGNLLGISTHPRSVFNHKKTHTMRSTNSTDTIIKSAIKI